MKETDSKFYAREDASTLLIELLEMPLYIEKNVRCHDAKYMAKSVRTSGTAHDMYCPGCKQMTTYKAVAHEKAVQLKSEEGLNEQRAAASSGRSFSFPKSFDWTSEFTLTLLCTRNSHKASYYFVSSYDRVKSTNSDESSDYIWSIKKVGQNPSVMDFHRDEVIKFKKILSTDQLSDLKRAMASTAHGFNIAACVYYRRIFEGLIEAAKKDHMAKSGLLAWEDYSKARTDQRIQLLKDELPAFMIKHPQLYSILSKGVHELNEKECGVEIDILHRSILLILNQQLIAKQAKENEIELSSLISESENRVSR